MRSLPRRPLAALSLLLAAAAAPAAEALPAGVRVVRLEAIPKAVALKGPFACAQVLLTAHTDAGDAIDATRLATWATPANLVTLSAGGLARPAGDGSGVLRATVAGQTLDIPVSVAGAKAAYAAGFVRDVQPAMSKMGCNAGTCHGANDGKNGFKLSLRGYDPVYDYRALTDDLEGRRFNRVVPERSLMLLKPSGVVPHVGGVLCSPGEPNYELLKAWIAGGVKLDLDAARVTKLDVLPARATVPVIGMKQQFAVVATYADGSTRDVSADAFIESSNTEVATVDKAGLVTTVRRGEATMLARYEGAYAAANVTVMGDRAGFHWTNPPAFNWIDTLVYDKLKTLKVLPSELCDDPTFARRVYLDLTGVPPSPEELKAFLSDARPTQARRDALIDSLIGSEAFVEHTTNKWADLLQVNRKFLGDVGADALRKWIRKAVADNMPYDQFARAILTGTGSTVENPPAAYYKVLRTPDALMENTTQLFLAVRFNCNKCHDHPFERWTQDQYYSLTAFFAQVGRGEDPKYKGQTIGGSAVEGAVPLVETIADGGGGETKHERTGKVAPPKFPFEHGDAAPADAARRQQLAHWLTSPKNPFFAMSHVNRQWSYLTGVGLIEPVDDVRAGNPPSNPALLERLTREFVASKFNTRETIRTICKSRTYQLAIETNRWNEGDDLNYAHAIARRLPAETLYDAIHKATGSASRLPAAQRATQLIDSSVEVPGGFLELFGKPVRESACECERSTGMMLGPVLAMVNGPVVADAVRDPNNRIAKLVRETPDDGAVADGVFLSVLSRLPTPAERQAAAAAIGAGKADYDRMATEYASRVKALADHQAKVDAAQPAWEAGFSKKAGWTVLDPTKFEAKPGGATLAKQPDLSLLATGPTPEHETYTVTAATTETRITGVRLEARSDDRLPHKGPGRAGANGNFVLSEFTVTLDGKPVKLTGAVADFSQGGYEVDKAIDGNAGTGWAVSPELGKPHSAVFKLEKPLDLPKGGTLTFALDHRFGSGHIIGRPRFSVTADADPKPAGQPRPAELTAALETPAAKRTPQQRDHLAHLHRSQDAEWNRLRGALGDAPPADHRTLGAQDLTWALLNSPAFLFNR